MTTELDVLEWSEDIDLELAYKLGLEQPNYPMPAIRQRDWVHIGYLSALNNFKTDDAFAFIQRYY